MADIFLRSADGSDSDNGSTWALAKATLAAALTAAGAGGLVYMSKDHAESASAALALTSPGTPDAVTRVVCVDDTSDPEPPTALATTGTVTTTTAADIIAFNGCADYYGVTFSSEDRIDFNTSSTLETFMRFRSCAMVITGTANTDFVQMGGGVAGTDTERFEFHDCSWTFGDVLQAIQLRSGVILFRGGSIAASGSVPTTTLVMGSSTSSIMSLTELHGVDLSALGSGKNIALVGRENPSILRLVNCKLGASVSLTTGSQLGQGGQTVEMVNCDSGDTNTRLERNSYGGIETQETTIVFEASDGTTSFSRKMASSANAQPSAPMESFRIRKWNDGTGSELTVTVEVVTDGVTLDDDEAWIEVEYPGTSGFPLSLHANDFDADYPLGSPANQTSSSAAWTTTGLSSPVKQKLEVAFTPEEKGWVEVRVMLGKASTTIYYDPKLTIA